MNVTGDTDIISNSKTAAATDVNETITETDIQTGSLEKRMGA